MFIAKGRTSTYRGQQAACIATRRHVIGKRRISRHQGAGARIRRIVKPAAAPLGLVGLRSIRLRTARRIDPAKGAIGHRETPARVAKTATHRTATARARGLVVGKHAIGNGDRIILRAGNHASAAHVHCLSAPSDGDSREVKDMVGFETWIVLDDPVIGLGLLNNRAACPPAHDRGIVAGDIQIPNGVIAGKTLGRPAGDSQLIGARRDINGSPPRVDISEGYGSTQAAIVGGHGAG